MSDSKRNLGDWIDDAVNALKLERRMYGSFGMDEIDLKKAQERQAHEEGTKELIAEQNAKLQAKLAESDSEMESDSEEDSTPEPQSIYDQVKAAQSLDELRAICESAEELHTDLDGTNLVFGVGNPHADLMIIGEAPGYHEDQQGEPFVGKAGQLLDKILAAINFDRNEVYIANILKHRPPNNRDPLVEERSKSLPFLMKQIALVDPKLILCLGRVSATTLLNRDQSLGSMRGKFHPFDDGKRELMVTYHPAALLRNPQWKRPTWEDVQLMRKRYDELGCKP
jgi:uracil-DNA glycosylase family 4